MSTLGGAMARQPLTIELIARGAAQHRDRIAVTFGDAALTVSEVDSLSWRLARALLGPCGVTPGTPVALLIDNGLLSVPVDFACVRAGINRVPLNSRLSPGEHAQMLAEVQARHLVVGPGLEERAAELAARVPGLELLSLGDVEPQTVPLLELANHASDEAIQRTVSPDEVILTLFTSGTTGTLKAARHTQASYAAIARNVMLNLLDPKPGDAMLHAASLIHASGVFVLPFWLRGARTVIHSAFNPVTFLAALSSERITAVNLVPTMLAALVDHPKFSHTDVSALQNVIYGASPMPATLLERAMEAWGSHRFWQYYGQTEAPLCLAVLRPEDQQLALSGVAGMPCVDVELRILADDGSEAPAGTPGEIAVRAPSAVDGYHNAPELTAATFADDGWVRTRDIGVIDEHGFLSLKDRTSDMIVTGGYNVYPLEVENALSAHPEVRECCVVGLPDNRWVEAVTAAVVIREGGKVTEPELVSFVGERLAGYKKPKRVVFVQEIPKTAVGKLNRRILREQLGKVQ
ncbi:acyl-CoA synthetase (AMP-forming)/AMP-acid ligase II [Leucobacter komagatae]|uniref:Acyl-CoA synthetase (AMP-forming)/AMP-acid ligase II n=1 Tax=Leucobacter komagatae TaxID=55969 RepID=A0A542Y3Z0_9MICO|nr:AMP-binding protein [Leucobacter komagatae]TQL42797.1 acyl-CoA synthetase (AMP-forming)/AMP-acid ligase II [Leucobacter komagatae]